MRGNVGGTGESGSPRKQLNLLVNRALGESRACWKDCAPRFQAADRVLMRLISRSAMARTMVFLISSRAGSSGRNSSVSSRWRRVERSTSTNVDRIGVTPEAILLVWMRQTPSQKKPPGKINKTVLAGRLAVDVVPPTGKLANAANCDPGLGVAAGSLLKSKF